MKQLRIAVILFLILCCSCGKKEPEELGKTLQEAISIYKGNGPVSGYALDKEGNVYIACISPENDESYCLYQYDAGQNLQYQYEFDNSITKLGSLAVGDGTIYFTAENGKGQGVTLYSLDKETKKVEILADYSFYDTIHQMFLQDGRLYLLGAREYSVSATSPGVGGGYSYYGDRIVYYLLDSGETYAIGIDKPACMSFSDNGRLLVHAYLEEEGYCMLEYDPVGDTIGIIEKFGKYYILYFAACNDGKDIIYSYNVNSRGLVLSPLNDMDSETELCPKKYIGPDPKLLCVGGEVCLLNDDGDLMRFTLADIYRENRTIRYISPGYQVDEPYGCGYKMERQEMEKDKFVLKVLAQDSDYDLCLIDTIDNSSYNMKKNGVFYPLNDVPGIGKYFQKCFPYVKEAATKEDGTIWMLPIAVYMPGLIVQEDTLEEMGVPLRRDMTWEEFGTMVSAMTEEEMELKSLSQFICTNLFFQQYFKRYTSVDNEVFRKNAAALRQLDPDMLLSNMREDKKYLFYYARYMYAYTNKFMRELYYGEDAKVYPMPKLEAGDVNTATCIFLAANPSSDRLEETLAFLADWIAWQMAEEDVPLYFRDPAPEEGTFEAEVYVLYQNGEIAFNVDKDIYSDGLSEMLDGSKDLEEYIQDAEQRLKIYFGE